VTPLHTITIAKDNFSLHDEQLVALKRALLGRLECITSSCSTRPETACVKVSVLDIEEKEIFLGRGVGLRNTNVSEHGKDPLPSFKRPRDVGQPCGSSMNWVRNVKLNGDAPVPDEIESNNRKVKYCCQGSLEVTSGVTGALEGATKRNVGTSMVCSRLCRRSMATLLSSLLPTEASENVAGLSYNCLKSTDAGYAEVTSEFMSLPVFATWRSTRPSALRDSFRILEGGGGGQPAAKRAKI
jgi:hypothetical protein